MGRHGVRPAWGAACVESRTRLLWETSARGLVSRFLRFVRLRRVSVAILPFCRTQAAPVASLGPSAVSFSPRGVIEQPERAGKCLSLSVHNMHNWVMIRYLAIAPLSAHDGLGLPWRSKEESKRVGRLYENGLTCHVGAESVSGQGTMPRLCCED